MTTTDPREHLYWYKAELASEDDVSKYTRPVVDGDSVYLWLDRGMHDWTMTLCRLADIDTPERGEDGFEEATDALRDYLESADEIVVRSRELGKYGRPIAMILAIDEEEETVTSVNDSLVHDGYAEWSR